MPRLMAYKHPVWTGRIVHCEADNGRVIADVRIDGTWHGPRLTGRVIGTRLRWYFYADDGRTYGIPSWCKVIAEWTGEDADAWRATWTMSATPRDRPPSSPSP